MIMEFRILDQKFNDLIILSNYESMLWVDRYNECGDFELYTPPTPELLEYCVVDNYLYSKTSEHMMIIERVELTTSFEEGDRLIIKGRSLESILSRRVLWYKTQFRSNLEDGIRQILDYSLISPDDKDRKIDNFIFEYSNDQSIRKIFVNAEYEIGTDLLTVIQELCKNANVGFKITLNSSNKFVFKLYMGANRSYTQDANPWVVFSPRYHNLKTTAFSNDTTDFRNAIRTVGKSIEDKAPIDFMTYGGMTTNLLDLTDVPVIDEVPVVQMEDETKRFAFTTVSGKLKVGEKYTFTSRVEYEVGSPTSLPFQVLGDYPHTRVYASGNAKIQNGRATATFTIVAPDSNYDDAEFFDISTGSGNSLSLINPILSIGDFTNKVNGLQRREYYNDASDIEFTDEMTETEYKAQLLQSAYTSVEKNIAKTEINGEVEVNAVYQYLTDYFMGDIVQVENDFGVLGTMRVTEFITSHSTSGLEMYPTFKSTGGTD